MFYTHFGRFRTTCRFRLVAVSPTPPPDSLCSTIKSTVAGPVSGFFDAVLNYPLIFIKNMKQVNGFPMIKEKLLSKEMSPLQFGKMAYSGFGSFYPGYAGSMIVSHFLNHQLTVMSQETRASNAGSSFRDYAIPVVSSGIAGWGIVTPTELLMFKQQEAASQKRPIALGTLVKNIFETLGIRGFFQSAQFTTARECAFGVTVFLPPVVRRDFESHGMPRWAAFFASNVVVSTSAAILSNPVDALSTRYRQQPFRTPLIPWLFKEVSGNMSGLMTKGLGTRTLMYFNGAVVLNFVRPLVEGKPAYK